MTDPSELSPADLARMARQHLESLRAAGIEWLPTAPLLDAQSIIGEPGPVRAGRAADAPSPPGAHATGLAIEATGLVEVASLFDTPPAASASSGLTVDERRHALEVLSQTVSTCTRCASLAVSRTQTVFGVGPVGAELCLIGEAPGADEDAQGEPFVGPAGQLLNRILTACGLRRDEVYICNIIKCRPPGNRTPQADEAANCREYLEKQIDLVKPRFICCLGATAASNLLGTTQGLGLLRRRFHNYRGIPVMCTYHPAYLLPHRNPAKKREVWDDMKMLMARMGRPVKQSN